MDIDNCKLSSNIISKSYIDQGTQALSKRHKLIKSLLSEKKLPIHGWDDDTIQIFIKVALSFKKIK